jgi:hypothetical protein
MALRSAGKLHFKEAIGLPVPFSADVMLGYMLFIALLNLGLGFGAAVYLGRNRLPPAPEEPETACKSSSENTATARASLETQVASRKDPADSEAESVPCEPADAVAEPAVAAAE